MTDFELLKAYQDTGLEPEEIKKAFNEEAVLKLAAQVLGTTPERLRDEDKARDEGWAVEPWAVCFRCDNRRSLVCLKCTRNAFAPCGLEKDDHFTRAEAEAAIGGGGDG